MFCFPHAGAGPAVFNSWADQFPPEIELCALRFPGRESRLDEPAFEDMAALLDALLPALRPFLDTPFAFFGHCSGSLIAFELARKLRAASDPLPITLVVSSCDAPGLRQVPEPIHALPPDKLVAQVARFGGVEPEVLEDPDLMELLEPVLRADFGLIERCTHASQDPLDVPIAVIGGLDDQFVGFGGLAGWRAETANRFSLHMVDAHHFVLDAAVPLVAGMLRDLLGALGEPQPRLATAAGTDVLHGRLLDLAEKAANRVALAGAGGVIRYAELVARARQVAHRLGARGARPGSVVGVLLPRSADQLTTQVGVALSGAALLPIDPSYPPERVRWMLQDSQAAFVVSAQRHAEPFPDSDGWLLVDRDAAAIAAAPLAPIARVEPSDLAYIIYTSGSTGRPKGVAVEHAAIARHIEAAINEYQMRPDDRVLQFASPSFDTSQEEVWTTLSSGGRLIVAGESPPDVYELCEVAQRHAVTVLQLPTSYWRVLLSEVDPRTLREDLRTVRTVIIGSEAATRADLLAWRSRALGDVRLVNSYGPTECVITATAFHIDPATVVDPAVTGLPIGTALRHRRLYVIDDAGRPVADTGTGQLAIGGDCIAQGYLGDPQLTAKRFVTDPFSTEPGARMYLTGDIVRQLADGNLEFLHRVDNQVKIQGYRIELGEIEAALRDLPHVSDAAALVLGDGAEAHLAAGVTATDGAAVDANHLRIALADALPTYMVPRVVIGVERLPVTLSGKVDRVRLAEILVAHSNGKA